MSPVTRSGMRLPARDDGPLSLATNRQHNASRARTSHTTCRVSSQTRLSRSVTAPGSSLEHPHHRPRVWPRAILDVGASGPDQARSIWGQRGIFQCGLSNPGTNCYINCLVYMLNWACIRNSDLWASLSPVWRLALQILVEMKQPQGNHSVVPRPREHTRRGVDICRLPEWGFLLHGWDLGRQEDAGEFLVHVLRRVPIPYSAGIMVLYNIAGAHPEAQPFTVLNVPVPVDDGRSEAYCLNHVCDLWSRSGVEGDPRNCLLLDAPNPLLIQLLRYQVGLAVTKRRTPIRIPDLIRVPTLDVGDIAFATYRCLSVVIHHGDNHTRGHYTTLAMCVGTGSWHLTDDHLPRAMSAQDAALFMARDMYILCLHKA